MSQPKSKSSFPIEAAETAIETLADDVKQVAEGAVDAMESVADNVASAAESIVESTASDAENDNNPAQKPTEATTPTPSRDTAKDQVPIIFLDDISVTFKTRTGSVFNSNKVKAVQHVTIKLMPGETIGLVGESGCGKSTTANVMCGLQKPTEGHVYFKGKDVTHRTATDRRTIGRVISVVFQDPATALNARMSVHDQLKDPLIVHKIGDDASREKRVHELIQMVGLPESSLDALPGQLSGGQRQRVAIARALSLSPDAIIADEPTSALDVSVRAQILNLLMDLKRDLGLAMVFISHDIQTVRYISDRIIVMNGGRIMEEGTAEQIFEHPNNDYTRLLLGAAPSLLHPDVGMSDEEREEMKRLEALSVG